MAALETSIERMRSVDTWAYSLMLSNKYTVNGLCHFRVSSSYFTNKENNICLFLPGPELTIYLRMALNL